MLLQKIKYVSISITCPLTFGCYSTRWKDSSLHRQHSSITLCWHLSFQRWWRNRPPSKQGQWGAQKELFLFWDFHQHQTNKDQIVQSQPLRTGSWVDLIITDNQLRNKIKAASSDERALAVHTRQGMLPSGLSMQHPLFKFFLSFGGLLLLSVLKNVWMKGWKAECSILSVLE